MESAHVMVMIINAPAIEDTVVKIVKLMMMIAKVNLVVIMDCALIGLMDMNVDVKKVTMEKTVNIKQIYVNQILAKMDYVKIS